MTPGSKVYGQSPSSLAVLTLSPANRPVAGPVANDFAAAFHLALREKTVAGALLSAKLTIVEQAKNAKEAGDPTILAIARQVAARGYCLFAHPDLRLAA